MAATDAREARKARLAEAVWRIILDQGIGAVSVRTVASEAGMAVGSLRHLFPTKAELLEFSAELMLDRATARVTATEAGADPVEYAVEVIRQVLPLTPETRREFEINVSLIAETPANPRLARIRDHAHEQLLELFVRIVGSIRTSPGGADDSTARDGLRLLALVDGLGMHLIHQPPGDDTEWVAGIVRDELVRIRER